MLKDNHIKIPIGKDTYPVKISTLCWQGDYLMDYIGFSKYTLTGERIENNINYSYRFDRALSSDDGTYSVLYENHGTKGLVLKGNKLVREINRSYYCANAYDYPVTIFRAVSGETCLAHCPEEYNIIEIEKIETGERLTAADRESHDFFQSRLQTSPSGKYLLSAGWVWHPVNMVELYDLSNIALPEYFNLYHENDLDLFEINSATFISDNKIAVSGSGEDNENETFIWVYDIENRSFLSKFKLSEVAGNMMAIDENYVVGFYEHPKLIELKTGEIVKKWTEIFSEKKNSSIDVQNTKYPPVAMDAKNKRFAVAGDDFIHVVTFDF